MKLGLAILAVAVSAAAASAHQLNVFAYAEDGQVVVESRFSNGNAPRLGEVRVLDAENVLLMSLPVEEDGTVRFPVEDAFRDTGVLIEVSTPGGHDNYWILTPEDIARDAQEQ